jgi:hypothetical protein
MSRQATDCDALRYIPAKSVRLGRTPIPRLAVRNDSQQELGKLDGFVVEPGSRKLRYAVVQPKGLFEKPRLVTLDGARLDSTNDGSLLIEEEAIKSCEPFDAGRYPRFSDEDLLTAVFAA